MPSSPLKPGYSGITVRLLLVEPTWVAMPIGNRQILTPDVGIDRMYPVLHGPGHWRSVTTSHWHLVKRPPQAIESYQISAARLSRSSKRKSDSGANPGTVQAPLFSEKW